MKLEELPFTQHYKKEREEKMATGVLYRLLFVVVILFVIFFSTTLAFNQKYTYITISGLSMQPTLNPTPVLTSVNINGKTTKSWMQDGVYVEKTKQVTYNDLIIIENVSEEKTIIKRLLALEGDYVSIVLVESAPETFEYRLVRIKSGTSMVEVLTEEYVKSYQIWTEEYIPSFDLKTNCEYEPLFYQTFSHGYESKVVYVPQINQDVQLFKVPEKEVFYLGDNRTQSADSRQKGTTTIDNVLGKVVQVVRNGTHYEGNDFYFLNRIGSYFKVIWTEILRFFGANI